MPPIEPPVMPPVAPPVEGPIVPPVMPQPPVEPPVAPQPPETPSAPMVPDVVGEIRERAEGLIRRAGFVYRIVLKVTEYPADGTVLAQRPAPGSSLRPGGEVTLEVAQAPVGAEVTVPGVVGLERDVAERMLRDAGFLVNVTLGGGAAGEQGLIVDQAPKPQTDAPRRSWVEIVVASGTGPRLTARGGPPDMPATTPPRAPIPGSSAGLSGPPAVGRGPVTVPPPTPRGVAPLPPVPLPPRGSPPTATVPSAVGVGAREAIASVLAAGLLPIIDLDRASTQPAGFVLRQSPEATSGALPGDLVRLVVSGGPDVGGRVVSIPMAIGAEVGAARQMFGRAGTRVDVVEVKVPSHPYAGTGRVAAQYPVHRLPMAQASLVTLWIVVR